MNAEQKDHEKMNAEQNDMSVIQAVVILSCSTLCPSSNVLPVRTKTKVLKKTINPYQIICYHGDSMGCPMTGYCMCG